MRSDGVDPAKCVQKGLSPLNFLREFTGLKSPFLLVLASLVASTAGLAQKPVYKPLDDQSFAALSTKRGAHLDVRVQRSEDLKFAVQIYTGRFSDEKFQYKTYNIHLVNNKRALVPYFQLSPSFKKLYLAKLWPADQLKGNFWQHKVTYPGYETLWSIAQWFTGTGQNHRGIKKASGLRSTSIKKGATLKIPKELLFENLRGTKNVTMAAPEDPVFTHTTPVSEEARLMTEPKPRVTEANPGAAPPIPKPAGQEEQQNEPKQEKAPNEKPPSEPKTDGASKNKNSSSAVIAQQLEAQQTMRNQLRWGSDRKGRYAAYKLKAGEAIYSAVVVRFCGLVRAEEVNRVAKEIISRNGIKDETDLAIGTSIRIPYDLLEPEFKAKDDPEYLDYVRNLREVSLVQTQVKTRNLEGVRIILDPGHGGRDPGAAQSRFGNVWEDDFVYDIACRIKQRLERDSAAKVIFTMVDPSIQYKVQNVRRFHRDYDEMLLTNPRFKLDHSRVTTDGVNLRWVYANYHYQKWVQAGINPENILFASIHADSLHHSIRGTMIYVPDARTNPVKFRNWANRYRKYREYKGNKFSFKASEMKMAQARSMAFASNWVESARRAKIPVHKQKPIRTVIHRSSNRSFVPAVVKYNRIPTRSLIEVCNLNNKKDREEMKRPEFRQKIADVFVEAVYKTYGAKNVQSVSRLTSQQRKSER